MVAVRQTFDVPEEPGDVAAARADVERLATGLSRALLATGPDDLRGVAARAARAQATANRWDERVGERPPLDPAADVAAVEAKGTFDAERTRRERVIDQCNLLLARGNALGIGALGVAGALVSAGAGPMGLPVVVAVFGAPIAPVVTSVVAFRRTARARLEERQAHERWCASLEATGLPTMGALAARRVAVAGWERRSAEAAAAREAARPALRAWQVLAGPGVDPADVEQVIARIEALRQAQIRLLGALLAARVEASAMSVLTPPGELDHPDDGPGWLSEALQRFRGSRLRLWGS